MINNKLSIFIITYNRAKLLARTLDFLASSVLKFYPIIVLDNASTDDTAIIAASKISVLPGLQVVTNHVNVGPNANFLKAFDYSNSNYTWVICDDDIFELNNFDDVLNIIEQNEVELIHVGAHKQDIWSFGGLYKTPKELLLAGYAYFKFASFMPCNIFKTDVFVKKYLVLGYNNVGNSYPHMPFAFGMYLNDIPIYIAKHQILFAQGGQHYSASNWFIWWMKTCELLIDPAKVRLAYLNQWKDNGILNDELGLKSLIYAQSLMPGSAYIKSFIKKYFTVTDKFKILHFKFNSKRDDLYSFRIKLKNSLLSKYSKYLKA